MNPWHTVERLSESHDVSRFTCGDDGLNAWLEKSALATQAEGGCGVHLCLGEDGSVLGFFALSMTSLQSSELPTAGNRSRLNTPAIVLAKLALCSALHSTGASSLLVLEALNAAVRTANGAGGSYLILDAPNADRQGFYLRHNFKLISATDPTRFYMKMSSARLAVAQAGVSV